jgi:signal transduction histidine kinase/ActR/RegA family two-component response regulator
MPTAPLRADEADRLRVLRELNILDTEPEERFDRLTRIAQAATNSPTALVSLVDHERQWFKSHLGLEACQTHRSDSFCAYVVLDRQPVVINDASIDPRTADMNIVVETPQIRAYAGYPLFSPTGHCLGSISVLDYSPRNFSPNDLATLRDLAAVAESELNNLETSGLIADLAVARDTAERATQAQRRLTATVGHEIRTALNGIVGVSELVESGSPISDSAGVLKSSSHSLLHLIDELLDYSKLADNRLLLDPQPTDIRDSIDCVVETIRTLTRTGVTVRSDCDADVPAWVKCDPLRLRQILLNLLGNAAKFTRAGTITVAVRPAAAPEDALEFEITDTGEGVTPAEATLLFEPFAQANASVARRSGGTGLGLAISRDLVQRMGGTIRFDSEKNVGSTFTFTISAPPTTAPKIEPTHPITLPTDRALRLLAAEDNRINRRLLAAMLKKLGHSVEFVETGHEAIASLADPSRWDAVLMDIGLRDLDGLAATRAVRANEREYSHPPIPIIAITADVSSAAREACTEAGMTGFLPKPITLRTLAEALASQPQ